MLMVLPLKLLNWLMLGDYFGLFPWAIKVIYVLYLSQGQILPMCMQSRLFEGITQATRRIPVLYSRSFNLNLHPKIPPKFFLLSKKKNRQCWLSSFRSQIINPSGVSLSRAFSGGKEDVLQSSLNKTDFLQKPISSMCVGHNIHNVGTLRKHRERDKWVIFWAPVVCSHEV